jgi:MoaA/NifB/PqqE/SkfB family radical SAM enzyme
MSARTRTGHAGYRIRRYLNSRLLLTQFRLLKSSRLSAYPLHAVLDPINICQLRCPICPQGTGSLRRDTGKMDLEKYKLLVDEIGPYLYSLCFTNWGEPLLHPQIFEMVGYARKFPAYLGFGTNLMKLDRRMAAELVKTGIDEIGVSLDGATAESYARYRVGGDFEQVLENVRLLARTKEELRSSTPKIRWQFLHFSHNEGEEELAHQLCQEVGADYVLSAPIYVDIDGMLVRPLEERLRLGRAWLPKDEEKCAYRVAEAKYKEPKKICDLLWTHTTVNPDGGVSPCCAVIDEADDFGNAFEEGFFKVWNGEKARAARRLMARGEKTELRIPCKFCREHGIPVA